MTKWFETEFVTYFTEERIRNFNYKCEMRNVHIDDKYSRSEIEFQQWVRQTVKKHQKDNC